MDAVGNDAPGTDAQRDQDVSPHRGATPLFHANVYCHTMATTSAGSRVLTFRASRTVVLALARRARRQRQTRSEVIRAILEEALRPSTDDDPKREARRQSLLVSRRASEHDTLDFVEHSGDPRGWQ